MPRSGLLALSLLAATCATPALAADSYDNCDNYIESLPASITTQGTTCLRGHRYSSQTSGAAVTIGADHVTLDCNGFRLSGFGAGAGTLAVGVQAGPARRGLTLRNCRIQGFLFGTQLHGAGHLVEGNHFDGNAKVGISVTAAKSQIRGNTVSDTGGGAGQTNLHAIESMGVDNMVLDNTVQGVAAAAASPGNVAVGIYLRDGLAQDNRISGLMRAGGEVYAIDAGGAILRENQVFSADAIGIGIYGRNTSLCHGNITHAFSTAISDCQSSGDFTLPE